jgi:hypothetical protein
VVGKPSGAHTQRGTETYDGIDHGQRPAVYWSDEDLLASLLRDVKGSELCTAVVKPTHTA